MNGQYMRTLPVALAVALLTTLTNPDLTVARAGESEQASADLQGYVGSWNVNGQRLSLKMQRGVVLGVWAAGGGFEAVPVPGQNYLQGTWRQGRSSGGFFLKLSADAMQLENLGWYGAQRSGRNEFRWTGRRVGPRPKIEDVPSKPLPVQRPQEPSVVIVGKEFQLRPGVSVLANWDSSWQLVELVGPAAGTTSELRQYNVVRHGRRGDSHYTVAANQIIPIIEPDAIKVLPSNPENIMDQIAGYYYGISGKVDKAAAKHLILQSSTDGNPLGRMWEAVCHYQGRCGFRKDEDLAQKIATGVIDQIITQSKQGDVNALYLWGVALHNGLGVDQDKAAAVEAWQTALDTGSSLPATWLAWLKGNNGEWSDAFRLRLRAALAGNVVAITALGEMYDDLNQSELALRYFSKSAGLGEPTAMFTLGVKHSQRNEVARAAELYRAAAEAGSPAAMNNLGSLYLNGKGVEKDLDEAERWFLRSVELGNRNAAHNLGVLHHSAERYDKAVVWWRRAAEAGHPAAMNNYGMMLFDGTGVVRDRDEGEKWLAKAAKAGVQEARNYFSARDNAAASYGDAAYGIGSGTQSDYSKMEYELRKQNLKMRQQFNQNLPGFQQIPPHAIGIR